MSLYAQWSPSERTALAFRKAAGYNAWDHENGMPVPVTPPETDLDVFTRIKQVIPEAAQWFSTPTIPKKLTLSTAMLNAEARADDQKADAETKLIREADFKSQMRKSAMEGKIKLLTDAGEAVCIVMMKAVYKIGTWRDEKTGKWNTEELAKYYRGDAFAKLPCDMPDALINWAWKKSGLLVEAIIYYNRDEKYGSGKNKFWHRRFAERKWIVDEGKIEELKLLLR